ncbi:hypothetical protein N7492_002650 [Penicillium capsulatum]|uniref:Uncharacterized protein n=1 Tax=Penicillium capsulatum TaxID=69766 RepID=A0A9W9LVW4_9EURO|nr:hypothetical protein N7492_002650 [Penicillium capsulatum]KAJ6122749.1 hypothetical protein N7512_005214 [Penicillium capsulatum]
MSSQRTVLITGCSDGSLGSHLAHGFHKAGWRVFASGRDLAKMKKAKESGMETVQLDTLSDDSISKCVSQVEKLTSGSLDVLVNNAGGGYSMPVLDIDIDKARKLFDLNVWSLISVTRAFFPLLRQSSHGGVVVNNTSCQAVTAGTMPFAGAYSASKAAAASLTEALRLELEPFGVKVVNLVTAALQSNFFSNLAVDSLPPDSVYNVAKEAVEKAMAGSDTEDKGDPEVWAAGVVKSVSKRQPPYWVWGGKYATVMRLASILPIGFLDFAMKKVVGLDVVERNVKEQGVAKS